MYAAEVLGSFSASSAMVATNFIRNAAFTGPGFCITTSMKSGTASTVSRCSVGSKSVGGDVFSVTPSNKYDVDYLGQSTKGDLNVKFEHLEAFGIDGHATLEGPIEEVARTEAKEAEELLTDLGIPSPLSSRNSPRGIFCSRTLNLRSISAIGYDMDYTLMHYNVMAWEGRAYDYCMENLKNMGFPVDGLAFDADLVIRGLVIDKERGNLVKADRFGYIKRAMHGTKMLSTRAVSEMYGRELVDLKQSRWEFLNTLFSVSEAVAYMQMVDRLDDGFISPDLGPLDYKGLYKAVGKALFRAHVEGRLKSEIMSKPEQFVEPDPELPLALLDQKEAGKKLLLITNSDYLYTDKMMQHSFNRFLPNDMGWRDLFDIVIVSARKPEFFQTSHPMYEVVTGEGLMRPCFKAKTGGLYSGGSAQMVENSLNIHGDEILYVGDHIYTDVSQSKVHLRWRTALICRELEEEYSALIQSQNHRARLVELINQKEIVGDLFNQLRLALQRRIHSRPAQFQSRLTFMVTTRSTSANPETHILETPMEAVSQQLAAMAARLDAVDVLAVEVAALKANRNKGKSHEFGEDNNCINNQWKEMEDEGEQSWGSRGHHKISHTKIEFPKFDGGDPRGWILKAEKYFRYYQTPEELKVDVAAMYLEGDALDLFAWINSERTILYWDELVRALQEQYGPAKFQNPDEHLCGIRQTGSVQEYRQEFAKRLARVKNWPEHCLLGVFLNGLKEELRADVRIHKPRSVYKAVSLALEYETKLGPIKNQRNYSAPTQNRFLVHCQEKTRNPNGQQYPRNTASAFTQQTSPTVNTQQTAAYLPSRAWDSE